MTSLSRGVLSHDGGVGRCLAPHFQPHPEKANKGPKKSTNQTKPTKTQHQSFPTVYSVAIVAINEIIVGI